ncbi:chromosomal replication initiator protein DnaA, partial [bacterium]|nr:chromosomal replication initiator protein DnaA [bacterium]
MENLVWEEIKGQLRTNLAPHIYHSLVAPTNCKQSEDGGLELDFENEFIKEAFEEKCLPAIKDILKAIKKEQVRLALHVLGSDQEFLDSSVTLTNRNPFDPKYTFSTFVIGSSNQFAHAACQAVSRQPGQSYNPLFIFGGAGLGKTHLLRAIGYELYQTKPNLRILFLTSEAFTNELIQAIRNEKMREFREKYRNGCDVLLLDDVHFLAGKERTQEEFFYTFNYLHESRKQIVITSDRYPKDIQGLENRLQTRFEWGLVADVQPPEIETRIAILQNKSEKEGIILPDEVAAYIASLVTTNIR